MVASVPDFPFYKLETPDFHDALYNRNSADDDRRLSSEFDRFVRQAEMACIQGRKATKTFDEIRSREAKLPDIEGLAELSDREILRHVTLCSELGEKTIDEAAAISQVIDVFRQVKSSGSVWNSQADIVLEKVTQLLVSVQWIRSVVRHWVDLYVTEFDRRHMGEQMLPFEPIDLGPTNSARMPPAI